MSEQEGDRFSRRALLRGRFLPLLFDAARAAIPMPPVAAPSRVEPPPLLALLGAMAPPAPQGPPTLPSQQGLPVSPSTQGSPSVPSPGSSATARSWPPQAVPPGAAPVMAPHTAMVDPLLCLAHRKLVCTVCVERCPVPGAMIVKDGAPRVDPRVCTGCQVCQEVCPAPQNAVRLMPRLNLPSRGGPRARP